MAERTLTVRLRAVADEYTKVLDQAGRATEDLAKRGERVSAWGDKATETGGKLTRGLTLPIAGVGAAAVLVAGNFEASMREVQALTGATGSEFEMLNAQAMKMGASTQFSASQAADAMGQLVKGGFDVTQTYQALPGIMQLAAAASIDLASAADIATNVLSGFGLEVSDLGKVNDYLAQTANASDTDVRELGEAFKYVGPVAKGAGMSLQETTAILGLFAENGIRGEMAGTALRGAITGLLAPSGKVAGILAELGISAVGANGQLKPMVEVVDQLAKSGATTGQIMEIFGQRAGPAMIALLGQGTGAITKFTAMLEESGGVAQNLADAKMGGLNGSIEQLKGSLETLAITIGQVGLSAFIEGIATGAGNLADSLSSANPLLLKTGIAIAGIAAASGPAIWAAGKMATMYGPVVGGVQTLIGKFQGLQVQMALARMEGMNSGQALAAMFGPGAAVLVGVAALAAGFYYLRQRAQEVAASHTAAADAAVSLGDSAGITLKDLSKLSETTDGATSSAQGFRRANQDAILTLKELKDTAAKQSYLTEIGYQLVLRGATPEQAFDQVKQLAKYAGVELPVNLTVENIGDFENQVVAVIARAKRAADMGGEGFWEGALFKPGDVRNVSEGVVRELDSIRKSATAEWDTGNFAGFIRILGESESKLHGNAEAANYLADESMKALGEGFGFSIRTGSDLATMLQQVASGATAASKEEETLANRILASARAMDGGLTPANLAAAASAETAGNKAETYGRQVGGAGGAAAGAAGGVDALGGELDGQAQSAEDAEKAFKAYLDTLRAASDPMFAMVDAFTANHDAQWEVIKAQKEYDAVVKESGPGSLAAADAASKLDEAHMRAAQSAQDVMIAAEEMNHAIENGAMPLETANGMLLQWVNQGLISADTASRLSAQFGFTAIGAGEVATKTAQAKAWLDAYNGTNAMATVGVTFYEIKDMPIFGNLFGNAPSRGKPGASLSFGNPEGRAVGGPVRAGGVYRVGEHGQEIVQFGANGYVHSAADSRKIMAAGQGGFSDGRIVDRLARLEKVMAGSSGALNVSYSEVRSAPTPDDLVRAQRSAQYLRTGR